MGFFEKEKNHLSCLKVGSGMIILDSDAPLAQKVRSNSTMLLIIWTQHAYSALSASVDPDEKWSLRIGPVLDPRPCTDIKGKKIFLIYKEIQRDRVQSHLWLTASSYMVKYLSISSYIRKPFLIYDFAPDPIWTSFYMRKILFSFLSGYPLSKPF